ncbi:MAG: hypothetical protein C0506_08485 [Anaerolinea sp.]|nr:hypothetical protein [Anaerolinea sp.]
MTDQSRTQARVVYEGGSVGTEIWGMTQANFLVVIPGRHAKETAVNLTDAAASVLAEQLGERNTPEFRQSVAREAGVAYLEPLAAAGGHVDSVIVVSEAFLDEHPEVLARLKAAAAAA